MAVPARTRGQSVRRNTTTNPRKAALKRAQISPRPGFPVEILGPSNLPLLRTSERGTFKRCRWKWWLEFHELVKPTVDVPPLRFGGLIHESLAAYYIPGRKRGPLPAKTFDLLYSRDLVDAAGQSKHYSVPELDAAWAEHRDMGIDMMEMYVEKYGADDEWEVLVTEHPFQTIVQHPVRKTPWFWYVGILDGVWLHLPTKLKYIADHKSTKAIQLGYLQMDDQATSYWTWGVDSLINKGLLAPDGSEHIDGMLFNFIRKAKRGDRPQNEDGYFTNKPTKQNYIDALTGKRGFNPKWKLEEMREFAERRSYTVLGDVSKVQPAPYHARVPIRRAWTERENARTRVLQEFADIEAVRSERAGHYKNPSQFTCGGCWAFDICELHEIGQDWEELRSLTTRKWEPYAEHEIKEGR